MSVAEQLQPTTGAGVVSYAKRKKLVRRTDWEYSQRLRRAIQVAFLCLNVWIGLQFYLWVQHYEVGATPTFSRPAGVEGWLPIAALMNLKLWLVSGRLPDVHPAGTVLLLAFLTISFCFRKAFCSWLCPIGTASEFLWKTGKQFLGRSLVVPKWLDLPLRAMKYLLLGLFAWAVASMTADGIKSFMHSPYGLIADVKMLNFFRYLSETAVVVLAALLLLSLVIQNFWCRYLCPYGALLGLASLFSPMKITRIAETCIDCRKCAQVCPSHLPVDKLVQIRSAECTACLECVAVCPAEKTLYMTTVRRPVPAWAVGAGVLLIFLGFTGYARLSGHWESKISEQVYSYLVPHAGEATHPMPGR